MKSYNMLYKDAESFKNWVNSIDLSIENACLVRIHTSSLNREQCVELSAYIKTLLPMSTIVGCPVYAVIYNSEIYDKETLISIRQFDFGKLKVHFGSTKDLNATEIANSICSVCDDFQASLGILLFDYSHSYFTQIVDILNEKLPQVSFVGGLAAASTETIDIDSFLFDENNIYENAYSVVYIGKEYILTYSNLVSGHPQISDLHTITKAQGCYVEEIDNVPATKWLSETLGISNFSESSDWSSRTNSDILTRFPLIIDGNSPATRFLHFEEKTQKLKLYYNELETGQKVSIGYLSPLTSAENWQSICHDLQHISAESIFCYSCLFRKVFLNSIAKWEMSAFKDANICGAFMYGEIGSVESKSYFLNGSCSIFTFAEKENYLKTDLTIFDHIENTIKTDDELIEQLTELSKQLHSTLPIFETLIANESEINNRLQINKKSSICTMAQFLKRQKVAPSKQLCLFNVINHQEQLSLKDEDAFNERCLEIFNWVTNYLKTTHEKIEFECYLCDNSRLAVVIDTKLDEQKFLQIFTPLYNALEKTLSEIENALFSIHLAYNLNGLPLQKLVDFACSTNPKSQHKIFHCASDNDTLELNQEFKMVALLNEVIDKNAVIPYFQGIYDNQNNCFYAYESLMRLQTPEGKILFPGDFMDISKKYDLYLKLSLCMVKKVFELFEDRNEIISLNISAYDVLSPDFQETVFDLLNKANNPQNFIFELLETERFENLEILRNFVHRLKQYGCQIAVDDFGSGYANFIEFGNVETDFLKINGSLTKLLGTDASYDNILDSIAFMGNKMQVKLIAEFVETASTQKTLVQRGVHYSQGYLFSKPMPFAELELVSHENQQKATNIENQNNQIDILSPLVANQQKFTTLVQFYGGIVVGILTVLIIVIFTQFSTSELEKSNNAFFIEATNAMTSKISIQNATTTNALNIISTSIASNFNDIEWRNEQIDALVSPSDIFEIYVSAGGAPAVDADGNVLDVDISTIYNKLSGTSAEILPFVQRQDTNTLSVLFAAPIYDGDDKLGEIYSLYDTSVFGSTLSLDSFGGSVYFNVFNFDGKTLFSSNASSNIYDDSINLYSFIDSLTITNGQTSSSIKDALTNYETSLLSYNIDNAGRTATISRIPKTDWVVVSIVTNEIKNQTLIPLQRGILMFVIAISSVYLLYFSTSIYLSNQSKKQLLKALEISHSLSGSLQTSIETDALTRTYTRATAIERINEVIKTPSNKPILHSLIILDVDNFKFINDNYGHSSGDIYLQSLVGAIKAALQPGNILGRLGGDEFVLLVNDIKSKEALLPILDNIFINIKKISMGNASLDDVSVCAGVVFTDNTDSSYEELSHKADIALYEAKRNGKDQYIFYSPETMVN